MTPAQFDEILEARIIKTRTVLGAKAGEYASERDRLHNFKRSAGVTGETPAQVCVGFFVKHLTSVLDIVDAHARTGAAPAPAVVDEKFGDAVNYLVLLEAILAEGRDAAAEPVAPPAKAPPAERAPGPKAIAPDGAKRPGKKVPVSAAKVLRVAQELRDRGPLKVVEIVSATGISKPTVLAAINDRPQWFRKPPGMMSPWELTDEGRRSLVSANGVASGH